MNPVRNRGRVIHPITGSIISFNRIGFGRAVSGASAFYF